MSEAVGLLAEALGRLVGWVLRRETVTSALELLGGTSIVVGLAEWSVSAALVALGTMMIAVSYRWSSDSDGGVTDG